MPPVFLCIWALQSVGAVAGVVLDVVFKADLGATCVEAEGVPEVCVEGEEDESLFVAALGLAGARPTDA